MLDMTSLFLGVTTPRHRPYLLRLFQYLKDRYTRLVIPACGKFAGAELAVAAGWPTNRIECSDVSLFSTTLAAAITRQPTPPITAVGDLANLDFSRPEVLLYAQKLAVLRHSAKQVYQQVFVRDLEARAADHIQHIRLGIEALSDRLAGVTYKPCDLFVHINEVANDPKTVIYINPPGYKGGYEKMFDTKGALTWQSPPYTLFVPKTGHQLIREMMRGQPALSIRCMYDEFHDADEPGEVILADGSQVKKVANRFESLLSNRPKECFAAFPKTVILRPRTAIEPIDAPIITDDHELTPDSTVAFVKIHKSNAMYYRDLWAHRLGGTDSETHWLMILDGYAAGIVGIHLFNAETARPTLDGKIWIEETYGFNAPSRRYPRLNRLLMMFITSRVFMRTVFCPSHLPLREPFGLLTTCLTQHPELKINRGIMKLVSRERLEDQGLFKLRYKAEWHNESFTEVLRRWLSTHGQEKFSTLAPVLNSGSATSTT